MVTCWERAWLLLVMFIVFCYFPLWYPGSGVVLYCIISLSLLCFLVLRFVFLGLCGCIYFFLLPAGEHGYNNSLPSMHPFFIAMGPNFKTGVSVETFNNVDIYPLMCHILRIPPAPNNGSMHIVKNFIREHEEASVDTFWACKYPGLDAIKLFSCSTQLSMKFQVLIKTKIPTNKDVFLLYVSQLSTKFIMLINVKMPTIVGILTFMSRVNFMLS